MILLVLSSVCSHAKTDPAFEKTVVLIKKALVSRDMSVLNKHVDLDAIVKAKVKKYTNKAGQKGLLMRSAGGIVNFSEPLITKSIIKLAMSEYSKSSHDLRKAYVDNIKITRMGSLAQVSYIGTAEKPL